MSVKKQEGKNMKDCVCCTSHGMLVRNEVYVRLKAIFFFFESVHQCSYFIRIKMSECCSLFNQPTTNVAKYDSHILDKLCSNTLPVCLAIQQNSTAHQVVGRPDIRPSHMTFEKLYR